MQRVFFNPFTKELPMFRTQTLASLALLPALTLAGTAFACPKCGCDKGATHEHAQPVLAKADIVDTAVGAGTFNTLAAALEAADLVDVLKGDGPFTVFAPTDEAFAALPEGTLAMLLKPENKALLQAILTYHVVPGALKAEDVVKAGKLVTVNGQKIDLSTEGSVMVDDATVTATDIQASNGVIHVIDKVIMPSTKDIIETAVDAGSFKTLAAALQAAELIETLQGEGPFTVFAPTDEAFAALPAGTVESLLKPENKAQLVAVLTYHVVPGRVYAVDALAAGEAATVQGSNVKIWTKDGKAYVNDAQIVATDIDSTNGVIHVINKVILPSE